MKKSGLKKNDWISHRSRVIFKTPCIRIYCIYKKTTMYTVDSTPESRKKDNAGFKLRGLGNHDHFYTLLIFFRKNLYKNIEKISNLKGILYVIFLYLK